MQEVVESVEDDEAAEAGKRRTGIRERERETELMHPWPRARRESQLSGEGGKRKTPRRSPARRL